MVNFFRKPLFDTPAWGLLIPLIAVGVFLIMMGNELSGFGLTLVSIALISAVLMSVDHAEVIALRVGEPFGTLILALAVTVIEVSLIVTLMLSGGEAISALARDTVFATVMIVCNGVIGLCLLLGAWRHRVLVFRVDGTTPTLSVLAVLSTLVLVLPTFTSSTAGATLTNTQLIFTGVVALLLYFVFVFVLTIRHREYFLPPENIVVNEVPDVEPHPRPSVLSAVVSLVFLLVSLIAVVGLAKTLAPAIEAGVNAISAPMAVVGVMIAMLVLLPETLSAVRAAMRNQMQISFNLTLGSALATIGLTIPTVAVTSLLLDLPLELGLPQKEITMLALTLLITSMTISRNSATVLQGAVHWVLFMVFLFLSIFP